MSDQHKLNADDVRKVAHLARLQIQEKDIPKHLNNLTNILAMIEQMNSIDTSQITPMYSSLAAALGMREDEVTEINHRDEWQKLAPAVESGLYLVPQVIEE